MKEKTKATPTQYEKSRAPYPMPQIPSSSPHDFIDLDSPPRESSPKRRRIEVVGLVNYCLDPDDEAIVITDKIMQNILDHLRGRLNK